jgi:choline kinase
VASFAVHNTWRQHFFGRANRGYILTENTTSCWMATDIRADALALTIQAADTLFEQHTFAHFYSAV